MVGPREKFKKVKVLRRLESATLCKVFANTVNACFNCTFIQVDVNLEKAYLNFRLYF